MSEQKEILKQVCNTIYKGDFDTMIKVYQKTINKRKERRDLINIRLLENDLKLLEEINLTEKQNA